MRANHKPEGSENKVVGFPALLAINQNWASSLSFHSPLQFKNLAISCRRLERQRIFKMIPEKSDNRPTIPAAAAATAVDG